MSVISEFSIPAREFVLGQVLRESTGLSVELDQMIPTGQATIPYFWVIGEGRSSFDAVLREAPELQDFEAVDELDDRTLYRATWTDERNTFLQTIVSHDAVLLEASGSAEAWTFELRFPDSGALSKFHAACRDQGIEITVESLYNPIKPSDGTVQTITEGQRNLIELAHEEGYFEIPRQITLAELGEDLGISGQSVNERLRRGLGNLVATTLEADPSDDE